MVAKVDDAVLSTLMFCAEVDAADTDDVPVCGDVRRCVAGGMFSL